MPRSGRLEDLIASRLAAVAQLQEHAAQYEELANKYSQEDPKASRGFRTMAREKRSRALKLDAEVFALRQAQRVEADPRQVAIPGTDAEPNNPPVRGRRGGGRSR